MYLLSPCTDVQRLRFANRIADQLKIQSWDIIVWKKFKCAKFGYCAVACHYIYYLDGLVFNDNQLFNLILYHKFTSWFKKLLKMFSNINISSFCLEIKRLHPIQSIFLSTLHFPLKFCFFSQDRPDRLRCKLGKIHVACRSNLMLFHCHDISFANSLGTMFALFKTFWGKWLFRVKLQLLE